MIRGRTPLPAFIHEGLNTHPIIFSLTHGAAHDLV
jgi:hypothetical protein